MDTKNLLKDASSCVYTSADLTISTIHQNKRYINISFIKYVPTPILTSMGGDVDGEMNFMRIANIDLDIETTKTLVETLNVLLKQHKEL